jgi:hypothetical protein
LERNGRKIDEVVGEELWLLEESSEEEKSDEEESYEGENEV